MISYALTSLHSVSRQLWAFRMWLAEHKWWRRAFWIAVLDLLLMIFGNVAAYAADGGNGVLAPFLPGGAVHDSAGVPLANYIVLPLDRGGGPFDFGKSIIAAPLDFIWTGHLTSFAWMIWLCHWVISFEWLQLLTVPFQALADLLEQALGRVNWIPFALAITAGVAGLLIIGGKKVASAWSELFISAVLAALALGILANPVTALTSAGGIIDTGRNFGNQLASAVVTDDINQVGAFSTEDVLSEAVSMQLVDVFVKIPAQALTFGHALEGECAAAFDTTMLTKAPILSNGNDVRDAVSACDPAAKNFVEHPNFGQVITAILILPGGMVIFGFPIVMLIMFASTAIRTLWDGIRTMWNVYWGILPVNRHGLWSAAGGMFMGAATITFLIVLLAASLRLIVEFLTGLSAMGIQIVAVMMLANVFLLVAIVMLIRAKIAARKTGQKLADYLSRFGLSNGATSQRDGTKAIAMMSMASTVAAAALRRPDRTVDNRAINFNGQGPVPSTPAPTPPPPIDMPVVPGGRPGPKTPHTPLPAGSGRAPAALTAGKVAKTADLALTAGRIAKGASGGIPGVVAAAGMEVGSRVVNKVAGKVTHKIAGAGTSSHAEPPAAQETFVVPSRTIVVDENGTGHIVRPAPIRDGVSDITSLPAQARSARNEAFRRRLEEKRAA